MDLEQCNRPTGGSLEEMNPVLRDRHLRNRRL